MKYGFPAKKMRVIGVTGTNGKTTTCFMIWKMLNEAGCKAGLLTTVGWGGVGGSTEAPARNAKKNSLAEAMGLNRQIEHMTTMPSGELNRRIKTIQAAGAEFLVLEVTSHAMVQFRTLGIPVEIAVMTNVTREHLDYHKTFAKYVEAKCKLFKKAQFGIVNADDKSSVKFEKAVGEYITYSIKKDSDLQAKGVELTSEGVKYSCGDINFVEGRLADAPEKLEIQTQIPGEFNVYNSLAAVAVGEKIGLTPGQIEKGIYALENVEGRMNRVEAGQDFTVIVDYAHQPDAFTRVYESLLGTDGKNKNYKRVITVTGGAGRRDKGTRAERGKIAGRNSDILIITEDDSRDEEPAKIAEMFVRGAEEVGMKRGEADNRGEHDKEVLVELNRKKAIELAIGLANKGDLVLILGKGHEKTILRADGPHPFEDLKVTKKALEERLK